MTRRSDATCCKREDFNAHPIQGAVATDMVCPGVILEPQKWSVPVDVCRLWMRTWHGPSVYHEGVARDRQAADYVDLA
jgi:hypothetical protein